MNHDDRHTARMAWLASLKPGDLVIVQTSTHGGERYALNKVLRVSPKGRITVHFPSPPGTGYEVAFRPNGEEISSDGWRSPWRSLHDPNGECGAALLTQRRRDKNRAAIKKLSEIPADLDAHAIGAILDEAVAKLEALTTAPRGRKGGGDEG